MRFDIARGTSRPNGALVAAIIFVICAGCHTADIDDDNGFRGPLRVGTSGDYAPFSSVDEQGRFEGFEIELARRFAKDRHIKVQFVRFRWPQLLGDLASNRFDVAMSGVTVRPERSLAGRFTVPIVTSGAVAIVASNSLARSLAALDQPGTRLGVNAGGHLERVTRQHFPHATVIASPDNGTLPDLLTQGKCDAIISDTVESSHWVARVKGARVLGPFTRDTKAWLVRKDDGELEAMLDRWLLERELDGTLGRLRRHYVGPGAMERDAAPLAALLAAMDERLSLMPLVAESKRRTERPVEDLAQESRVLEAALEGVRKEARARACPAPDENAVRAFFQAQIEAAKEIQRQALAAPPATSRARGPDLDEQLRPALARIGERISRLIVELHTRRDDGHQPKMAIEQTSAALQGRGLSPAQIGAIADAMVRLMNHRQPAGSSVIRPSESHLHGAVPLKTAATATNPM